jgi:hypothetical protein
MTNPAGESPQRTRAEELPMTTALPAGAALRAPIAPGYDRIVTKEALAFVVELERRFGAQRRELLARRQEIQARIDSGWLPDFLPETQAVRSGDWRVAPIPKDLMDRRVEITGPVDRKMVINALNCGASADSLAAGSFLIASSPRRWRRSAPRPAPPRGRTASTGRRAISSGS